MMEVLQGGGGEEGEPGCVERAGWRREIMRG